MKKFIIAVTAALLAVLAFSAATGSGGQLQTPIHDPHKAPVHIQQVPFHDPGKAPSTLGA